MNNEKLNDFLASSLNTLRKRENIKSLEDLSKALGITKSTVDRILKKEIKKTSICNGLKIVQKVYGQEKYTEFLKEYYPEVLGQMKKVYPNNTDAEMIDEKMNKFLESSFAYELIMKATSNYGISNLEALEEFGRRGLDILEELVKIEQIKKKGSRFYFDKKINTNQRVVQKLTENLIKNNYDIESFGKKDNWLSLQYESVNQEKVMPAVRQVLIEANYKIKNILNEETNRGDDIVWVSLLSDNLSGSQKFI
ncbi:MAG: hypothetical protein CME61_01030 [Halobacteriovoraceae bacterium]|nr:hypothetical protein [Halobacteriovoraceae bacterium]